jgi:hypothetical protein
VTERFIGFFRLVDACEQDGCPVCRCVIDDGRRHLDALLYEQVNDPETRQRLRASWGLCSWHTWMLREIPGAGSGAAILYEDLLRGVIQRLRRLRDRSASRAVWPLAWIDRLLHPGARPALVGAVQRRRLCPLCIRAADAEARYVQTVLQSIGDPQFSRAYQRSAGLCVPHLLQAVERGRMGAPVTELVDRTLTKLGVLRQDLDRFVGKHDHRNGEPFTREEASACTRAFELLVGKPSLFGNDVHGRASRRVQAGPQGPVRMPESPEPTAAETEVFDRRKLELRVTELTAQLAEATSRAAALHYRLAQVSRDRDGLEMNLAGERGSHELARGVIADLRAENDRLRSELDRVRREATAAPLTG